MYFSRSGSQLEHPHSQRVNVEDFKIELRYHLVSEKKKVSLNAYCTKRSLPLFAGPAILLLVLLHASTLLYSAIISLPNPFFHHNLTTRRLSFILHDNPLRHAIHDLGVEFGGMVAWETDILGQIIGQDIHEVAIPVLVEKGLVRKLGILVAEARWRFGIHGRAVIVYCQMEVKRCQKVLVSMPSS